MVAPTAGSASLPFPESVLLVELLQPVANRILDATVKDKINPFFFLNMLSFSFYYLVKTLVSRNNASLSLTVSPYTYISILIPFPIGQKSSIKL
jgi:hypothetical protein